MSSSISISVSQFTTTEKYLLVHDINSFFHRISNTSLMYNSVLRLSAHFSTSLNCCVNPASITVASLRFDASLAESFYIWSIFLFLRAWSKSLYNINSGWSNRRPAFEQPKVYIISLNINSNKHDKSLSLLPDSSPWRDSGWPPYTTSTYSSASEECCRLRLCSVL